MTEIKGEKAKLEERTKQERDELETQLRQKREQYMSLIDEKEKEIANLHMDIAKLSKIDEEKRQITEEIHRLEIEVKEEKKLGMIEVNERERAKIFAVQKLSQEMDF